MNYIIAISGKAGHGKDSLADFLKEMFLEKYSVCHTKRIGFADKLKEVAADLTCTDYNTFDTQDGKMREIAHMGNITGREVLLILGTEIGRKIYPDIWAFHYKTKIARYFIESDHEIPNVVFTNDLRFMNEYAAVNGYKFHPNIRVVTVRVVRPDFVMPGTENHSSETSLDHIDRWDCVATAHNLVELKVEAKKIFESIVQLT